MLEINTQSFIVGVLILGAALYIGRMFYRQFYLGKADCHCGSENCQMEKKKD